VERIGAGADGADGLDGAAAGAADVVRCFFAQLESRRHPSGNASAANRARVAISSDRSADAARGQEQNHLVLVFRGSEHIIREMVLGVSATFGTVSEVVFEGDVHFFLDFRLKEPYI
jgi:hypothetical protein